MSNNSQENGALSMKDALSLLNTPVEDKVTEERLEEQEAPQPMEAEAEVIEQDQPLEEEVFEDGDEVEVDEVEETDEEDDGEEEPQETLYTVKVDGEDYEVTLDELRSGYSRTQFFTQRSQELAEQRKAFEAQQAETQQLRDQYAQQLELLAQQIQQTTPQEPDWVALSREVTAEEFNAIKAQYDTQKAALERAEQERQRIAQEQQAEQSEAMKKHLATQRDEMMNRIPSWQDEATRNEERLEVIKYAQRRIGFSEEEISNASDARAIELLYKAWKWDTLQEKKPAVKKRTRKAPKMAKAGQPKTKAQVQSRSRQQAMQRLNKERSLEAALNYLNGS